MGDTSGLTSTAPDWALAMLANARVAHLGTASRDGRPLVVPVCFDFDGRHCYSAIDAKPKRSRRLRRLGNIEQNPIATLLVDHYEEDWQALRWVMVEGACDLLSTGQEDYSLAIRRLQAKYPQYLSMDLERTAGPVIRLHCNRIQYWQGTR